MKYFLVITLNILIWLPACGYGTDLVIAGVTLIDGTGDEPRADVTIVVRNGRISSIEDGQESVISTDATIIDAAGKFVIPGLSDMHVHFGSGGFVSDTDVERILQQFLFYGVTTVFNLGGSNGRIKDILEYRQLAEAGKIAAPQIFATGGIFTIPESHPVSTIMRLPEGASADTYDWSARGVWIVESVDEIAPRINEAADAGMDGVKVTIESGPSFFGDHHPQMSPELVKAAVAAGDARGLPVYAHVSSIDELEIAIDAGVRGVVHLVSEPNIPDEKLMATMASSNIYYVPTLSLDIWPDTWGDPADNFTDPFMHAGVEDRVIRSLLNSSLLPSEPSGDADWAFRQQALDSLRAAHKSNVTIVAGSDSANPTIFPGYSLHHELALMVEAGLSPMEALVSATRRPAEMLGRADDFGTIKTGMRADMLVLAENPLEDIKNTRTLEMVIQGGKVLDRQVLVAD